MPFVFCGRLEYLIHDMYTSNPVHIYFKSLDYEKDTENINLKNIYEWKLNNNLLHRKEIKKVDNIFKTEIKNDQINNLKKENIKHKDEIIIKELCLSGACNRGICYIGCFKKFEELNLLKVEKILTNLEKQGVARVYLARVLQHHLSQS